jgi:hypothetical protein
MNDERLQTVEQVKQFLAGSEALDFGGISVEERYPWKIITQYYRHSESTTSQHGPI